MANRASELVVYKRRNRAANSEQSSDRISDLPDGILHHILSFLPIKRVAQAGVLSKRWSYLWASFPILDFSQVHTLNDNLSWEQISTVLSRRHENSNIKVFRVRARGDVSFSSLDDCIRRVMKHRVQELELDVHLIHRFDLQLCVFECDSLRCLKLDASTSWYVGATTGLRSLHTLSLIRVEFLDTDNLVADLFSASSFPSLVNLTIGACVGITHLKISCPNLKDVKVFGQGIHSLDISGMRLENLEVRDSLFPRDNGGSWVNVLAPNLRKFDWSYNVITEKCSIQSFPNLRTSYVSCELFPDNISTTKVHSAVNLLSGSSQVQNLYIVGGYLQILSKIYFEAGLPYSFVKLEKLVIGTGLKKCEIPGLACLFKSSPMVHTLKIGIHEIAEDDKWNNILLDDAHCTEEQYWESQDQTLSGFLSHIKGVIIVNCNRNRVNDNVFNFIRFLLQQGRRLQKMILSSRDAKYLSLWKDKIDLIEGFPRASAHVEISVKTFFDQLVS